jgi:hypothetical protein
MESSFLEPSMIRTYIPHVIYPYRVPYMWECGLAPSRPFVADHHLFCRSRRRNPGRVFVNQSVTDRPLGQVLYILIP